MGASQAQTRSPPVVGGVLERDDAPGGDRRHPAPRASWRTVEARRSGAPLEPPFVTTAGPAQAPAMRRARTTSGQSRLSSQSAGRPRPSSTWYAVSPPTRTRPRGRSRASVVSAARRSAASTPAPPAGDVAAGAIRAGALPDARARAAWAPAQP